MSKTSTEPVHDSAHDLIDRWLAHHRPLVDDATPDETAETVPEPVREPEAEPVLEPVVALQEIAPTGPPAPTKPPEPAVSVEPPGPPAQVRRPSEAPVQLPGLVLFSPRRGARRALTVVAAVLAAGAGLAGYRAWESQGPTDIGIAGGLALALLLAWTVRRHTHGSTVSIEKGVLRIVEGNTRHLFPLAGTHPPISILGEPGRRGWKVLIQRRGMPPFAVTRRMVEPVAFTEAIRHFRPEA